jgi:hypothetical protein
VASRAWLHPAIDVANSRQRHGPAQTDTIQRAYSHAHFGHVNLSRFQGCFVLMLRASGRRGEA